MVGDLGISSVTRATCVALLFLLTSCATGADPLSSTPSDTPDAAPDGPLAPSPDAPTDASSSDAGPTDASPSDAGPTDASPSDAGPTDGGAGAPCATYSDCTSPAAPVCSLQTLTCIEGYSACVGDDSNENANDGIAGAVAIPLGIAQTSRSGLLCSEPAGYETDYFKVQVVEDSLWVRLAWSLGTEQFKANIYRDNGTSTTFVGTTASQPSPQTVHLSALSPGTYLIVVWRVTPANSTASSPYSITVWTDA